MTLDERAQARYEANDYRSLPTWDQIGDITKGYWRERVLQADGIPKDCWEFFLPGRPWHELVAGRAAP